MRISSIVVTLVAWCFLSRDAGGKPIEMGDTITNVLTRALGGSDKEKTEALSLVLELLAEIDLPSLCQSITAKSTDFTRVDDIIARAATDYGMVTPSGVLVQRTTDRDSKQSREEKSQPPNNLNLDQVHTADLGKTLHKTSHSTGNEYLVKDLQTLADSYDYFSKIHTLPQQYPDYNSLLLPANNNYDFYDVNDNLIYDITGAAGGSSQYPDINKKGTAEDKNSKDSTPLFFPEDLLALASLAGDGTDGFDEVIVKGSKSLKPDSKLIAENLKMEGFDGARRLSYGSVNTVSTTYGDESWEETTTPFSQENTNGEEDTNIPIDSFVSNDTSDPSSSLNDSIVSSSAATTDVKTQTAFPMSMTRTRVTVPSSTTITATSASKSASASNSRSTSKSDDRVSHSVVDEDATAMKTMDINDVKGNFTNPRTRVQAELFHYMNSDMQTNNTDRDLLGYSNTRTASSSASESQHISISSGQTSASVNTSTLAPASQTVMSTESDDELGPLNNSLHDKSESEQATSTGQTRPPSAFSFTARNSTQSTPQTETEEQLVTRENTTMSRNSLEDTAPVTVTTINATRLEVYASNMSASELNISANNSMAVLDFNDTTSNSFVAELDISIYNHTRALAELQISETSNASAVKGKNDDLPAFSTESQASTTLNAFFVATHNSTAPDISLVATEDKGISNRPWEIAHNDTVLAVTTANTAIIVKVTEGNETSNILAEEADFNRTSSEISTDTINSTMARKFNASVPTISSTATDISFMSNEPTKDWSNAAASLDTKTRLIPEETWTTEAFENNTATIATISNLTTLLTSDTPTNSSLVNSSDTATIATISNLTTLLTSDTPTNSSLVNSSDTATIATISNLTTLLTSDTPTNSSLVNSSDTATTATISNLTTLLTSDTPTNSSLVNSSDTATTATSSNLTTMLTSDTPTNSSLVNSSDSLTQISTSTHHTEQVFNKKSDTATSEETITQSEDSGTKKAVADAHYQPERLWWRPAYYSSHKKEQKTIKRVESTDGTEFERSLFTREPFSLWTGRQVQDKWSHAKNSLAAADPQTSRRYSHTGPSYSTYTLNADKLTNDQNTPIDKDTDEKVGSVKSEPVHINDTSTSSTSGETGKAETQPEITHSQHYFPYNHRSYPRTWAPISSHFPLPNLGTLWGINRDSRMRGYQGLLKYNDLASPPSPRYILPGLKIPMNDNENESEQSEASYEVKDDSSSVINKAVERLGLQQKTVWSEAAASSRLQPHYKGYACPGLFGYFGDFMDCRSFFICSWGVPYRFYCPSGTRWNPTHSVCDWARNVVCPN